MAAFNDCHFSNFSPARRLAKNYANAFPVRELAANETPCWPGRSVLAPAASRATSTVNTHSWNETEVDRFPPKTGGSLVRRIFNELEENEPPRAGGHVLHGQHSRKESRKNRMQVPVSNLETKFREEPSLATSCNGHQSFVIWFIRKYSGRTEREQQSRAFMHLYNREQLKITHRSN